MIHLFMKAREITSMHNIEGDANSVLRIYRNIDTQKPNLEKELFDLRLRVEAAVEFDSQSSTSKSLSVSGASNPLLISLVE